MNKLQLIQKELKAPKNQRNNFGNYNYRSAEDILEAVKPLLAKHECTMYISDTIEEIGGRVYVKATVTFRQPVSNTEDSSSIVVTAYAREEETKKGMDGSQITGASSSYARKYALNGLFLIDDTKDSDATNTHDKEVKASEPKPKLAEPINIEEIKEQLKKCKTRADIAKIWNDNKPLHSNKDFEDFVKQIGEKLKSDVTE